MSSLWAKCVNQRLSACLFSLVSKKNLYTESHLKLDQAAARNNKQRLLMNDPITFKENLGNNFKQNGIRNIFSDDINKLLALSDSKDDLALVRDLLKASANEDLRLLDFSDNLKSFLTKYFEACHLNNLPEEAVKAWEDADLQSTLMMDSKSAIPKLYFDLLFRNSMYEEILSIFSNNRDNLIQDRDVANLVLMACYKIGTKESLKAGLSVIGDEAATMHRRKGMVAIAWLAHNLEEFGLAYDLMNKYENSWRSRRPALVTQSIKVTILVNSGRLEEAITYLRTTCAPREHDSRKAYICFSAISKLVESVRKSENQAMIKDVLEMVQILDQASLVVNKSVDELLLDPSKEIGSYMREKKLPIGREKRPVPLVREKKPVPKPNGKVNFQTLNPSRDFQ